MLSFKPGTGTITDSGGVTVYAGSGNNKIDSTGVNTPWTITGGNVLLNDTWIAGVLKYFRRWQLGFQLGDVYLWDEYLDDDRDWNNYY